LITRPPGYLLRVGPDELDVARFERLVGEARAAEPANAAEKLREALALWRGAPLADLRYETFVAAEVVVGTTPTKAGSPADRVPNLERDLVLGPVGPDGGSQHVER
jgi:hypothetical protein